MNHPEGAREMGDGRLGLTAGCGWNFVATQLSSDGRSSGDVASWNDVLGLSGPRVGCASMTTRVARNTVHRLGRFCSGNSVYGRLAGYETSTMPIAWPSIPVIASVVVGGPSMRSSLSPRRWAVRDRGRLALTRTGNAGRSDGQCYRTRFHDRKGLKGSSCWTWTARCSPTHGDQEGTRVETAIFDCTAYHPLFLFNSFGMLERLRPAKIGNASQRRWLEGGA